MNIVYISKETHIRYVNERIIIFNKLGAAFPMMVNTVLLQVLSIIIEENQVNEIKNKMFEFYSTEAKETEVAIQLLAPYLTDDINKQSKRFSTELHRVLLSFKQKGYAINKQHYIIPKKALPELLSITLTQSCGRRCIYCFAGAEYVSENRCRNMNFPLFQSIIKQASLLNIKHIELNGGDPFVIPNIDQYVKCVIDNGMSCFISTKQFVNLDMVQKLHDAGLRELQISLDSSDEQLADMLMGVHGSYKRIIQTIQNFKAYNFKITIRCVILRQNIHKIPDLIELCNNLGIERISFNLYGMSCGRHNPDFFASEEDVIKLSAILTELQNKNENLIIDFSSKMIEQFVKARSYGLQYKHYSRGACGAMTNSLIIRDDGKAVFCANLSHLDEMVIGDLNKQSIMEIWNETSYKRLVSPTRQQFSGTECERCNSFDFCMNKRCYFRVWMAYGRLYDKDPLCKYGNMDFNTY